MSDRDGRDCAPQKITAEHDRLSALFGETRTALLSGGGRQVARAALARLVEAVETHLVQEESLYYPTIWALRPEFKPPLLGLIESHPRLRVLLVAIEQALNAEALEDAKSRFDQFVDSFSQHQKVEEQMLVTLGEEIATSS